MAVQRRYRLPIYDKLYETIDNIRDKKKGQSVTNMAEILLEESLGARGVQVKQ